MYEKLSISSILSSQFIISLVLMKREHVLYNMWYPTSRAARGGGGSFKNRKRKGEIGCCESRMTKRKHWWIEVSNGVTD